MIFPKALLAATALLALAANAQMITQAPTWRGKTGTQMSVRLRQGNRVPANGTVTGLLEVQLASSGPWGTVCDDSFSSVDAAAACRSLGYTGVGAQVGDWTSTDGTSSTLPILMDDTACMTTDVFLWQCTWRGTHNCGHSEDVRLICNTSTSGIPAPSPGGPSGSGPTPSSFTFSPSGWTPGSTTLSRKYYTTRTSGGTRSSFSSSQWSSAVNAAIGSRSSYSCYTTTTSSSRYLSTGWSVTWRFSSSSSTTYLSCQAAWDSMTNSLRSPAFVTRGYGSVSYNSASASCVGCASLAAAAVGLGIAIILVAIVVPICCCIIFWSLIIYCFCCKKETVVVVQGAGQPGYAQAQPMGQANYAPAPGY
jgi:hypothetical protein